MNIRNFCIKTMRKFGTIVIPVDTKMGYDIATALRGPDYPIDVDPFYYDILKYIFTARIRELMGCNNDCGLVRHNLTRLKTDALVANITILLQNMTVSRARCLVHWAAHIEQACLYFGNYPEYAAASLRRFLASVAFQDDSPEIQNVKMRNAVNSISALLEHEHTYPDTCWQLPKEWR